MKVLTTIFSRICALGFLFLALTSVGFFFSFAPAAHAQSSAVLYWISTTPESGYYDVYTEVTVDGLNSNVVWDNTQFFNGTPSDPPNWSDEVSSMLNGNSSGVAYYNLDLGAGSYELWAFLTGEYIHTGGGWSLATEAIQEVVGGSSAPSAPLLTPCDAIDPPTVKFGDTYPNGVALKLGPVLNVP